MDEVALSTLVPGERGKVSRISGTSAELRRRLLEMGLNTGTAIQMIRFAPFGDPIEIHAKGFRLSLRKLEAESIMVNRELR
ncbi:MAG: ferrous iron transport protein A [Ignavibacteria bacterium]|nr:ferrous iron transport protein A [Ignavibacteria bacterium]